MPARIVANLLLVLALDWLPASADDQPKTKQAAAKAPFTMAHTAPLHGKDAVDQEADNHTRYRVEFNGIKEDRVPGFLYVPKGKPDSAAAPHPAILLQYGTGGNKKTDYIVAIGKQFVGRGFVVLTIDSPGCGERRSQDKKAGGINGILGKAAPEQIMHFCSDYSRAVDYLATRPEVDKDRLGYVGVSWGAITGITYVAYDPRIKAVGSMVGGGNFLGRYTPEAAAEAAREGSTSSDPVFHVARIAPRPLLFINVTKDQLIAKPWAESLHKAAGEGSKVVWLETDHYFKNLDRTAVCASVIDFMEKGVATGRGK